MDFKSCAKYSSVNKSILLFYYVDFLSNKGFQGFICTDEGKNACFLWYR